ncbi:MAG: FkbM family methyltransferase [Rhizobium sp.]
MFVSYSQNFEDVILWRVLKNVENGFYVDIGAQDPVTESVSRGFYEKGWRGIHAEATTYYADKVRQDRPDEVVVQAAIGTGHGSIRFFEFPDTGLSTSDHDIALKHQAAGFRMVETDVPLMPLSAVLVQAGDREIHWLKVDVEGMEASVIDSWAPSPKRPWIVVMESTLPTTQETNHHEWEHKLFGMDYRFAYFDGVNRFYISAQHPELLDAFGPGPNIFDGFGLAQNTPYAVLMRSKLTEQDRKIGELHTDFAKLYSEQIRLQQDIQIRDERLGILESALSHTRDREAQLGSELHLVYRSLSWRVTRPLREINVLKAKFTRLPRQLVRVLLEKTIRWLSKHAEWKDRALRLLYRFPRLRAKLEAFARARGYGVTPRDVDSGHELEWYIDAPKGFSAQWKQLLENIPTKE